MEAARYRTRAYDLNPGDAVLHGSLTLTVESVDVTDTTTWVYFTGRKAAHSYPHTDWVWARG